MKTIAAKCDEFGDCLIWRGARNSHSVPTFTVYGDRAVNVKRWIAKHVLGLDISGKFVTTTCMDKLCVSPDHVKVMTRGRLQQAWSDHLQYGSDPVRRAKLAESARARSVFDLETIQRIRDAEGKQKDIAKELGVPKQLVSRVKRGAAWQEFTNNPWLGLMPGGRSRA